MSEVLRLPVMSARHFLDEWFESAELKGLLSSLAVRGAMQGPFGGGSTFNLLHHMAIGDGLFRATARGGTGAICTALAEAAKSHGAKIQTSSGEFTLILKDGTATGVRLTESGEIYDASEIISDYDAAYTFRKLVEPPELEPEFNRQLSHTRYNGCVARMNFALNAVPNFTGISEEALRGTLVLAGTIADLEKSYDGAKYGSFSKSPYMEITIPSLNDPSVAPAGKHTISLWVQYTPYKNKISAQDLQDRVLAKLNEYAPDFTKQVQQTQVIMPAEFESKFNLTEGHLYGGDMTLTQAFYLRPIPGFAQYTTPIDSLYLCGSATHPGGGLSGLGGKNAANELSESKLPVSA
jgi:phytoene dehydrogenase-like protein